MITGREAKELAGQHKVVIAAEEDQLVISCGRCGFRVYGGLLLNPWQVLDMESQHVKDLCEAQGGVDWSDQPIFPRF